MENGTFAGAYDISWMNIESSVFCIACIQVAWQKSKVLGLEKKSYNLKIPI